MNAASLVSNKFPTKAGTASARLGPRDLAIPVDAVEDCIEKAALRQFIRLFEDECAAWMAFPGKLALYRQGLSILVDPEITNGRT